MRQLENNLLENRENTKLFGEKHCALHFIKQEIGKVETERKQIPRLVTVWIRYSRTNTCCWWYRDGEIALSIQLEGMH